ncbi:MAG: prepilin-type N-terminal cleavage/methylation domain-containing protein [Agarilytica sp.]
MHRKLNKNQKGFNLTELLIVVAIVAIIAAVALPSYNDSVRKTKRSEGKSFLLEVAQLQERHYTEFGRYATEGTDEAADIDRATMLITLDANSLFSSESGHYTIPSNALGAADGTSFNLTATASFTDTDCPTLSLSNLGVRTPTTNGCW